MKEHDEEREIYGAVYVQGKKYFLLSDRPSDLKWYDNWMPDGMVKWLVAADDARTENESSTGRVTKIYYVASTIYFNASALVDVLPVPLTKKVIRFYVTDDEEA